MGKRFQKILLMSILPFLLGVGACSMTEGDSAYFDKENSEDQIEALELNESVAEEADDEELLSPCLSDEENCEASDNYLTQKFTQKEIIQKEANSADEDSISLSRPAGKNAVSVKDKKTVKAAEAAMGADVVTVETKTLPRAEEKSGETVLYTTVAIPEEIGTNTTTETKLTTTKITKKPAAETAPAVIPAGMIPLKKTVTTITETTTKVKEEKKPKKDFSKMTVAERVAYGESEQEWDARSGWTLRSLLSEWGAKSGWVVVWKLDRDYHLEAGVIFEGTFVDVSSALIRSFARATPAPIGTFHRGNRVLVVSTQEDENER